MSSEELLQLAKETESLALKERDCFSPTLRRWQPTAAAVAAVTLHGCYGAALRQYVGGVSALAKEAVEVLQRAGRLEKVLVQMVVEDSAECEDGGKSIVREMVPYEVDSVISNMLRVWIDERFVKGRDCLNRAKETEVSTLIQIFSSFVSFFRLFFVSQNKILNPNKNSYHKT